MAPKPEGVVSSPHTHSEARSPLTRQTQELTSEICHRKIQRQNHCSVLTRSCPTLCDLMDYSPPGSSVHRDSPSKNTGVGCQALLQGIFPTQGLNPGLSHCRQILHCLSHQGSHLGSPKQQMAWGISRAFIYGFIL